MWDHVLAWLSTTTSKSAVQDCAVALLSVLASRALTPNLHLRSQQLWNLPVLQLRPVARPTMELICAAFAEGLSVHSQTRSDDCIGQGRSHAVHCAAGLECCTLLPAK